jgi:crotonobetainyl-CoA:carnitine CoA-transferase CaiB-like acyl-CoA transferase
MKPLEGIRVLDLSHALSGPTCTIMLAMLGADVIKVERPGVGDDFRHYTEHAGMPGMSIPFAGANAGKRSITLDFKKPGAREVVLKLAQTSDLLVENFRPGVAQKLKLDYETLRSFNKGLVYASISGFGQTGTFRDWTAYDHIVQAMSGIMWMNGDPDGGPMKVGFPIIDTFSGYMAVIGLLAALHRRDKTGEGDFVDVAMLDSAFNLMGGAVPTYFYTGEVRGRTGNRGYRLVATSETYPTADGYIAIGANHQHQIEAMCRVLDCGWLLEDARFADHKARVAHYEDLRAALTGIFENRKGEEIEPLLAAANVPVAFVRNLAQALNHPHFKERDIFLEAELPGAEAPLRLVGPGFQLGSGPLEAGPVPRLGEHTDAILRDLGYDEAGIAALRAAEAV